MGLIFIYIRILFCIHLVLYILKYYFTFMGLVFIYIRILFYIHWFSFMYIRILFYIHRFSFIYILEYYFTFIGLVLYILEYYFAFICVSQTNQNPGRKGWCCDHRHNKLLWPGWKNKQRLEPLEIKQSLFGNRFNILVE